MRILIIHNRYQQPSGEDIVVAAETALLRQHGDELVKYLEDNKRINGMNRVAVAARTVWSRTSRRKLLGILRNTRPDVAHFHNTFLLISPSAYHACWQVGVPVVQTLHNYRLFCPTATFYRDGHVCEDCLGKSLPWPGVVHACYRKSRPQSAVVAAMLTVHRWLRTWQDRVDLYIALTKFARRKLIEGGLPAEKIVVKSNFIHPDPGVREGDGSYALFVGRLSPEKGITTLLKAWQNVKQIPLVVVGDGPLMCEVQAFVQKQKLEGVAVLGRQAREETLALMKGARFLLFPSEWYEGFPMSVAEAFSCGVPVVASRLGAMTEIVEVGQTGLHFALGDPEDLAAKIEWAWTHPKQMQAMGREARRKYEQMYTAERNYRMLVEIYQQAIERHKRG